MFNRLILNNPLMPLHDQQIIMFNRLCWISSTRLHGSKDWVIPGSQCCKSHWNFNHRNKYFNWWTKPSYCWNRSLPMYKVVTTQADFLVNKPCNKLAGSSCITVSYPTYEPTSLPPDLSEVWWRPGDEDCWRLLNELGRGPLVPPMVGTSGGNQHHGTGDRIDQFS